MGSRGDPDEPDDPPWLDAEYPWADPPEEPDSWDEWDDEEQVFSWDAAPTAYATNAPPVLPVAPYGYGTNLPSASSASSYAINSPRPAARVTGGCTTYLVAWFICCVIVEVVVTWMIGLPTDEGAVLAHLILDAMFGSAISILPIGLMSDAAAREHTDARDRWHQEHWDQLTDFERQSYLADRIAAQVPPSPPPGWANPDRWR